MADALIWVMERRVVLADRAERLRKELAEIDAEVARLTAEVVIGQFIEAERAGHPDAEAMAEALERATTTPGRAGCCWSRTVRRAWRKIACRTTTGRS